MPITTKRIINLDNAASVANDDYIVLDGTTNGTRKFATSGKGLSKNDYTDAEKTDVAKIDGIETEVTGIRTGYDGTVYNSAGDAVRGQVSDLNNDVQNVTPEMTTFVTPKQLDTSGNLATEENNTEHGYISPNSQTGNITSNQYTNDYCVTDYIEVEASTTYAIRTFSGLVYTISEYDEDKAHIVTTGNYPVPAAGGTYTVGATCKYIKVCLTGNSDMPPIGTGILVVIKGSTIPSQYVAPSYIPLRLIDSDYVENSGLDTLVENKVDAKLSANIKLELPTQYELVVDDIFELFWKGVINAVDYENYFVDVVCDIGRNYKRKFHVIPSNTDIGTHSMTVTLYDNNKTALDTKTINLVVAAKATSPASETVVLYVTDSLGNSGYVPDEFHRRLTSSGGSPVGDGLTNITFIGNSQSVANNIKYVGNGGWTWVSYLASMRSDAYMWITCAGHGKDQTDQHSIYEDSNSTQWKLETIEANRIKIIRVSGSSTLPATGTLTWVSGGTNTDSIVYTASEQAAGNPFYDEDTSSISFSNFVTEQGETSLDYVYVLLCWNSSNAAENTLKGYVRQFIDNILADFPNCKIVILGLEIPAQDGLGYNYGQNAGVLSSYQKSMQHVFNLNKWYYEISQEVAYSSNVSFVNIAGQFDTEYNMQTVTTNVNTRNATTMTMQSNGVHPAESGYYQIADACYRDFVHKIQ